MTCEILDRNDERWFICWSKPPKEKKVRCSVCKRRWSTLLCDGVREGPTREVAVLSESHRRVPQAVMSVQDRDRETCDAPLCEQCTTRPEAGVVALPDHRETHLNGMALLHYERRAQQRRPKGPATRLRDDLPLPAPKAIQVDVPDDTRDFCPACVDRMQRRKP